MLNTESKEQKPPFGTIRSYIWPIHHFELKKLLPMFFMVFLIALNSSLLRNMKDSVVVTASGAEVIPFIKLWVMLPMAVVLTIIFTKLSNWFSQERVFYIMTTGFLCFFAFYTFVLYPQRDTIHPHAFADHLMQVLPGGARGFVEMVRNWSFTSFYVMSELWIAIVLNVLFWGFANEITKIGEARRFYAVLALGANFAAIVAGFVGNYLELLPLHALPILGSKVGWEQKQMSLLFVVIACGILTMAIFRWMNKNVLTDASFDEFHYNKKQLKMKGKLSFRESFSYLSNSKYLLCIAVLVVGYNLVINLVEVVWKDQVRTLYPNPSDFNDYSNKITMSLGVISTMTALFMAKIIGRFGWTKTALITPIIMLITCAGFFTFFFFQDSLGGFVFALTGTTPLAIAVFFGAVQNCLSKAAKYSVFDATTQMAYIPLSHECKLKGKAAIDGVGSRLGKSGGSFIHQGLLLIFETLPKGAPVVAGILGVMIALWIMATRSLGRQFNALVAASENKPNAEPFQAPQEAPQAPRLEPKPLNATS